MSSPPSAEQPPTDSPGKSDRRRILGAAGIVSGITLLSRVLGVVRDGFLTRALGHGWLHDTFLLAFEAPNLLRRVLGEGSLSAYIVPIFTDFRTKQGEARGWRFANNALLTMTVYTGILTILGWFAAEWIFVAFGGAEALIHDKPEVLSLGTHLVRIMIPFMMLLAIAAMMMGLLHTLGHFVTPALGSIVLNVVLIGVCWVGMGWDPHRITTALAWGVVAAGGLRIALMIPSLVKRGWRWRPVFQPRSDGMMRLYAMMVPATAGMAIAHVNIIVDKFLARWIEDGCVVYLNYANHLVQFPLAIFAGALATAILPTLARRMSEHDRAGLQRTMNSSLRLMLLIFLPATAGLIALRLPIVSVIFEGRAFDATGSRQMAWALMFYAVGLVAFAGVRILLPLYYARQDLRTPLWTGAIAMIINIALNLALMRTPLRHGGLALATSIAALVNLALLIAWLGIDVRSIFDRALVRLSAETLILSLLMGAVCWLGWRGLQPTFLEGPWALRALITLGLIGLGTAVFAAGVKLLRIHEMEELMRVLRRRR
ncbi:murein biosynthesis integral membrane protein MurJ [Candidatus Sumerlaeota bacterium]|nr:murein biosynthesis integral membrane protein MurJ [Candidatus Sumerlaeota bacterium]